jgi:hypothetical protein
MRGRTVLRIYKTALGADAEASLINFVLTADRCTACWRWNGFVVAECLRYEKAVL